MVWCRGIERDDNNTWVDNVCETNEMEFYGIVDVAKNPGEDSHGCGAKDWRSPEKQRCQVKRQKNGDDKEEDDVGSHRRAGNAPVKRCADGELRKD